MSESHELGALKYSVAVRDFYLRIAYEGAPTNVELAARWEAHIDSLLGQHGLAKVLWDSRRAGQNPPTVRDHIWAWLERAEFVKASAILVESKMLRVTANMSAIGTGLRIRSFHDVHEAIVWLHTVDI